MFRISGGRSRKGIVADGILWDGAISRSLATITGASGWGIEVALSFNVEDEGAAELIEVAESTAPAGLLSLEKTLTHPRISRHVRELATQVEVNAKVKVIVRPWNPTFVRADTD